MILIFTLQNYIKSKDDFFGGKIGNKVFNKVAGDTIQVHGGIGFTWEHPAHLYFKKAKSDSLIFGTSKSARNDVARLLSL